MGRSSVNGSRRDRPIVFLKRIESSHILTLALKLPDWISQLPAPNHLIARPAEPRRNGLMFESQVWLTNCFGKRLAATCYFTRRKTVARLEISQILSLKYALADFPPQLLQAQQQAYSLLIGA